MKMLAAIVSAALITAVPAFADDDDAPKGDLAKLQGSWKGKGGPHKDFEVKLQIKGKAVSVFLTSPEGEEFEIKGEVKLDEKASPKTIDWIKFKRPDNGEEMPDNLGLYELKGDEFKVCSGGPGGDRPKELKEGEDGMPMLMILTRVKDEKKAEKKD